MSAADKVVSRDALVRTAAVWRADGKTVALANGSSTSSTSGTLRYLEEAAKLADYLVVAINDDASARALKGPDRPIVPEAERAELIAGFRCVTLVTLFGEAHRRADPCGRSAPTFTAREPTTPPRRCPSGDGAGAGDQGRDHRRPEGSRDAGSDQEDSGLSAQSAPRKKTAWTTSRWTVHHMKALLFLGRGWGHVDSRPRRREMPRNVIGYRRLHRRAGTSSDPIGLHRGGGSRRLVTSCRAHPVRPVELRLAVLLRSRLWNRQYFPLERGGRSSHAGRLVRPDEGPPRIFRTSCRRPTSSARRASQYFLLQVKPEAFTDGSFDVMRQQIVAAGGAIVGEMPVAAFTVRMTQAALRRDLDVVRRSSLSSPTLRLSSSSPRSAALRFPRPRRRLQRLLPRAAALPRENVVGRRRRVEGDGARRQEEL